MQIIFQDPFSSLDPRMTIKDTIREPLMLSKEFDKNEIESETKQIMDIVGIAKRLESAYPHELDGGRGQLVETSPSKELFQKTLHPYTKALLSAIPSTDIHHKKERILLQGEVVSPINPKPGCRFSARRVYACPKCSEEQTLEEVLPNHFVSCCRVKEINNI